MISADTQKFVVAVLVILALLFLTGCTTPQVGRCTPSSDLPAKKVLKKVPERVASPKDLYDLFVDERAEHGRDIRDYNSLYSQCVK